MKVKEIIESLEIDAEKLISQLDNVGIEADIDTEIPNDVIKKLSKLYKKDIKPIKAKKSTETSGQATKPIKPENQSEGEKMAENAKEEVVQEKAEPKKPEEEKKEPQKKEQSQKKEEVKKEEQLPKQEVVQEEIELSRVYDDKYIDFEEEKTQHTRIKNVKKNKAKSTGNRKANVPQEKQMYLKKSNLENVFYTIKTV